MRCSILSRRFYAVLIILILIFGFSAFYPIHPVHAASIQHPRVVAYGDVTKDVYPGRSIFEYKDDQGLSSTLPFERQDKNITIPFSDLVFDKNFENSTITDVTSLSSTVFTASAQMLGTDNPYILLSMTNSSAVAANTAYFSYIRQLVDIPITNDYYILVTGYPYESLNSLEYAQLTIKLLTVDSGGVNHWIEVNFYSDTGTNNISYTSSVTFDGITADRVSAMLYGITSYYTYQAKLGDLLSQGGLNVQLQKITRIYLWMTIKTAVTITDSSITAKTYIRHIRILSSKLYIDDPSYTYGILVNGTQGIFTPAGGDKINIYGANVTKIVGLTIPWQKEIEPDIETDADNLKMQYTWSFTMSKSPTSGDSLVFSNMNLTLYGYKPGSDWDKLYLNGVDKLTNIANLKPDATTGYWTYALTTSLGEGNMYQVIARIQYTADEYDSLTTEPIFWSNPVAWIQYKFWQLLIAIASFLGLGTAWARRKQRGLRRVRR